MQRPGETARRSIYSASRTRQIFAGRTCPRPRSPYPWRRRAAVNVPLFPEDSNVNPAHLAAPGLWRALPAAAHPPQKPPHQLYSESDLKLESGEAIKDFSISYVTHGTLNARKSNAILMVTAVG